MPPPLRAASLPEIVLRLIVTVLSVSMYSPPPSRILLGLTGASTAWFPLIVLSVIVISLPDAEPSHSPPPVSAVLPEMELRVMVIARMARIPPPCASALLFETVLPVIVSRPKLSMPPPVPLIEWLFVMVELLILTMAEAPVAIPAPRLKWAGSTRPFRTVIPEMLTTAPLPCSGSISKIRSLALPSIIVLTAPLPVIVILEVISRSPVELVSSIPILVKL